jgi:glucose/mannose transport system substrate-binding protein
MAAIGCRPAARAIDGDASSPAVGPSPSAADDGGVNGRPIELFTWWPKVGEADALEALSAAHRKRYPGDVLIDATAGASNQARSTLRRRMEHDEPPDTFQANAGRDLMQWVLVNGVDDSASRLEPLNGLIPDVAEWRRVMPQPLLDLLTHEGKLYGVPSNVHRINSVFYSRAVFRRFGLSEPKTLDDLRRMARKLDGSGVRLLALGSRDPWTLALVAFECLLVAREGPAFYQAYFGGRLRTDDPRVVADLDAFLELVAAANDDHAQLSWLQALDLVISGKAAMTIMGDWARGALANRGLKLGDDYGEIAFPQTDGVFVFTSDAFGLPKLAKNREGAVRLLQTMGSVDGQRAMNGAKDALSARVDVPPGDPVLEKKLALLKSGPLVLALSGLVPGRFADDVAGGLADTARQHDAEPAIHALRSRYALLK